MDTGASGLVDLVVGIYDMIFSDIKKERPSSEPRVGAKDLRGLQKRKSNAIIIQKSDGVNRLGT